VGNQDGRSQIGTGVGNCFALAAGAAHYQNRKYLQNLQQGLTKQPSSSSSSSSAAAAF
jgi:hypothetical protein